MKSMRATSIGHLAYALLVGCSEAPLPARAEAKPPCTLASLPELPDVRITSVTPETAFAPHCKVAGMIGPDQQQLIASRYLEKCDALDGIEDGILTDPKLRESACGRFPALLNAIAEMVGRRGEQAQLASKPWTLGLREQCAARKPLVLP
jgi:hypothetical protein